MDPLLHSTLLTSQSPHRCVTLFSYSFIHSLIQSILGKEPPNIFPSDDLLIVGCWDKTLSFYKFQGNSQKLHSEKTLKSYPCSISLAGPHGNKFNYLIVSGSDKKVSIYSRDGVKLSDLHTSDSWVWSNACHAGLEKVFSGSDSGEICAMQMSFDAIHALNRERYAYRDNLTEIIVQHLVSDRKVRIKCKDLVNRLALYKNKLAVQLTDRVCIYESNSEDYTDMHFRLRKERITIGEKSCDHIAVTSNNILFCRGNMIESYTFTGIRERVWLLDGVVRYIKVDGGPDGKEGIIIGLDNGLVLKIYVDNPFPVELTKRNLPIINADVNIYRTKIACVENNNVLTITDLKTQQVIFTYNNVLSACFNNEVDGTLCFTTQGFSMYVLSGLSNESNGTVAPSARGGSKSITDLDQKSSYNISEPQEQYSSGLAFGFQGQKIFSLFKGAISVLDVPQGTNMTAALDNNDVKGAYSIACLGATEADWKVLAMRALRANNIAVAKNAFSRLKDIKFLTLIEAIEKNQLPSSTLGDDGGKANRKSRAQGDNAAKGTTSSSSQLDPLWLAEVLAYEGHYYEAAKSLTRIGKVDEAIRLFTDLRKWNDAKLFAQNAGQLDVSYLTVQQAKWLQEINDWKGSCELYITMGNTAQAIKIISDAATSNEAGWQTILIDIVRTLPTGKEHVDVLNSCGDIFTNATEDVFALETYQKAGNYSKLMSIYIKKQMWNEAAALAENYQGSFDTSVFLPYAEYLISQDKYVEAMEAYKKADRKDLAKRVLEELTSNAVSESRFKDAAYYYWLLSKESEDDQVMQYEYVHKADLYFAYSTVHAYVTDPFTSHQPETLFQVARFIINSLGSSDTIPRGLSKANTFYTLAKQATVLQSYKLARHAYDRLSKLQLPVRKQEEVELDMLVIQAKPVRDDPDHLPVCYRCGSTNPLLNPFTSKFAKGDVCTNCGHPFVRSFVNFDTLPLVEFVPDPSISDEEAIDLIRSPPGTEIKKKDDKNVAPSKNKSSKDSGWKEGKHGSADTLTFDGNDHDEIIDDYVASSKFGSNSGNSKDLFTKCLNITLETQGSTYKPVILNANALVALKRSEVFVCRPSSKNKRATFYRNMLPDIAIAISQPCHRFFHLEDFEFAYLSTKSCPYSKLKSVGEYGSL